MTVSLVRACDLAELEIRKISAAARISIFIACMTLWGRGIVAVGDTARNLISTRDPNAKLQRRNDTGSPSAVGCSGLLGLACRFLVVALGLGSALGIGGVFDLDARRGHFIMDGYPGTFLEVAPLDLS